MIIIEYPLPLVVCAAVGNHKRPYLQMGFILTVIGSEIIATVIASHVRDGSSVHRLHLKPKSREISLAHNSFISYSIVLKKIFWYCRSLCKISNRLDHRNGSHERTTFREISIEDKFRTDILYCTATLSRYGRGDLKIQLPLWCMPPWWQYVIHGLYHNHRTSIVKVFFWHVLHASGTYPLFPKW